jgi:hypothetical protein
MFILKHGIHQRSHFIGVLITIYPVHKVMLFLVVQGQKFEVAKVKVFILPKGKTIDSMAEQTPQSDKSVLQNSGTPATTLLKSSYTKHQERTRSSTSCGRSRIMAVRDMGCKSQLGKPLYLFMKDLRRSFMEDRDTNVFFRCAIISRPIPRFVRVGIRI